MADIPATITVNGLDITAYVDAESVRFRNNLGKAVDSLSFRIRDSEGAIVGTLSESEVVFADDTGAVLFGGTIKDVTEVTEPLNGTFRAVWECDAIDYAELLQRPRVLNVWVGLTDAEILADVFAEYLPEVNATTYVQDSGVTFQRFVANRINLTEIVDRLAAASGNQWYVDSDKNLRYFPRESFGAPFGLSSSPDDESTFAPINLQYEQDTTALCNQITVVGGMQRSLDATFLLAGNGTAQELLLPYRLHAPDGFTGVQISRNTGTLASPVWTPQTVGIDNIDDSGTKDVLYNFAEKLLRFAVAPANLANAVRIIGQYDVPIIVRKRSFSSFDRYGAWYEDKHVDEQIRDVETAQGIAAATLAERAFARERLSFETYRHGLRAGQTISVFDEDKGIDASFTVQSVSPRITGNDLIRYSVEAGAYNPDLVDLLREIRRKQAQESDDSLDAVLTELLGTSEALRLVEAYSYRTLSGVYRYSPTATDSFTWGLMSWTT